MTGDDPDGVPVDDTRPGPRWERELITHRRRDLLTALASGGGVFLAGCGGGPGASTTPGDSTTTSTRPPAAEDLPRVQGQTFRAPVGQHPSKTAFYGWGLVSTLKKSAYAMVSKEPAGYGLRRFLRQPGVWIDGMLGGPRPDDTLQYTWLEDPIQITPTHITVSIRDDATWSDGHPITGKDVALRPIERTLYPYSTPPAYAPPAQTEPYDLPEQPQRVLRAFDDFDVGDKSVTYRSAAGQFDAFIEKSIALWLGPFYPSLSPTHIDPFDAYADAVIDTARRAQNGDIHPWFRRGFGDPDSITLVKDHLVGANYVRKFSKPENVLATGVWDLVATDGTEFVFEPNAHHPAADAVNFDQFRFVYTDSVQRQRAALSADRLDYAAPGTTPQTVVEALPDSIEPVRVPGAGGTGLKLNFDHPAIGTRAVRLALMYAIDRRTIANNVHPSLAVPVTTPGGDAWNADEYVSQNWIDETLTAYHRDVEEAARLMREGGYTRQGGRWIGPDGRPLTLTLPTPRNTPTWEPAVASQLSEFGIDTTVRTMDATVFATRRDDGEFAVWPGKSGTAFAFDTVAIWRDAVRNPDRYGIFPDAQFETGEFSDDGVPIPRTAERWSVFTIRAAPIGHPAGTPREYHPAALVQGLATLSDAEFRRRVKVGMWLANWYLPILPITNEYVLHFIDDAHWLWPTDTVSWKSFTEGPGARVPKEVLGNLSLRANPDDPEAGAKVRQK